MNRYDGESPVGDECDSDRVDEIMYKKDRVIIITIIDNYYHPC